jgi:hypothetical protein
LQEARRIVVFYSFQLLRNILVPSPLVLKKAGVYNLYFFAYVFARSSSLVNELLNHPLIVEEGTLMKKILYSPVTAEYMADLTPSVSSICSVGSFVGPGAVGVGVGVGVGSFVFPEVDLSLCG